MEFAARVDGDASEGNPAAARVPGEAAEGAVTIVRDVTLSGIEIDPSSVRSPSIAGDKRVGDDEAATRGSEVHVAGDGTPSVFVCSIDGAGGLRGVRDRRAYEEQAEGQPAHETIFLFLLHWLRERQAQAGTTPAVAVCYSPAPRR